MNSQLGATHVCGLAVHAHGMSALFSRNMHSAVPEDADVLQQQLGSGAAAQSAALYITHQVSKQAL